jgi:hypothetical protein
MSLNERFTGQKPDKNVLQSPGKIIDALDALMRELSGPKGIEHIPTPINPALAMAIDSAMLAVGTISVS